MAKDPDIQRALRAKNAHEKELLGIEGVVGVGVGFSDATKKACIKAYLREDLPSVRDRLPTDVDGVDVEVEQVGDIVAQ